MITDDPTDKSRDAALPNLLNLIWASAEDLRGAYTVDEYSTILIPFLVLRRTECLAHPERSQSGDRFRSDATSLARPPIPANGSLLNVPSTNRETQSRWLSSYLAASDRDVKAILEAFNFAGSCEHLVGSGLLVPIAQNFGRMDLRSDVIDNAAMASLFEGLLTRFARLSQESAGENYTPTDIVHLMVHLLLGDLPNAKLETGDFCSVFDPAAGTGGNLSVAGQRIQSSLGNAALRLFGQEINRQAYAICKARLFLAGQSAEHIQLGDTLASDAFKGQHFDFMLSNPPFGMSWKTQKEIVEEEHRSLGSRGRFGPGLPRTSDSQMLFMLHLISKMHPKCEQQRKSRIAIITSGNTLSSGEAGSGESEIRRYILENDLVEAIVALPGGLYYNTALTTYIWLITNAKPESRRGLVQLVDGSSLLDRLKNAIGRKSHEITRFHAQEILELVRRFQSEPHSVVLSRNAFVHEKNGVEEKQPYVGIPFANIFLDEEIKHVADRTHQKVVRFREVVCHVSQLRKQDTLDDAKSNAAYLPRLGSGPAVTSIAGDATKYLRLVIREDIATARYVAAFYNSAIGRKIRRACESGAAQQRLSIIKLESSSIPLPSQSDQLDCIEADTVVENLISELSAIRGDIWREPTLATVWLPRIQAVNKSNSILTWLDTIPYPLAAILLMDQAANPDDYKARYEILLHFFEALSEFLASIFLSAITSATAQASRIPHPLHGSPLRSGLRSSTFGSWVELCNRFSGFARSLYAGSEEQRMIISQAFGSSNPIVLEMLLAEQTLSAIGRAKALRNDVKSHGGFVGKESARATHAELEGLLAEVRREYGHAWSSLPLYHAGTCSHGKTILQTVQCLMGRSVPFPRKRVVVTQPVDEGKLFLLPDDGSQPLTLLPLITMGPSPEAAQTSFYFYNRVDEAGPRYVSYQFAQEPEIVEKSVDVRASLENMWSQTDRKRR